MKSKNVIRNRLITILFAIFFCSLVLSGLAAINFSAYADETTYTYELESVEVSQNPDWIFTNNTPDSMLYKMMSVTVTYKEVESGTDLDPYVLDLSSDGTAATGEKVTFKRNTSARTVEATVTPKVGDTDEYDPTAKSGTSAEYTLEDTSAVVSNGITASYTAPNNYDAVTTTTSVASNVIKQYVSVYETFNDGSVSNSTVASFNLSGDLYPSVFVEGMTAGSKYSKEISVVVGDEPNQKTAPVTIKNISYVVPDAIWGVDGEFQAQVARSKELNMNKLYVVLQYGRSFLNIPVSVFPSSYFTPEYYTKKGGEKVVTMVDGKEQPLLNITVTYVKLYFDYPGLEQSYGEFEDISVDRIPIHTPVFNTEKGVDRLATETEIPWNNGAALDLESWDFDNLDIEGDAPNPQIKVYKLVTGKAPELLSESFSDDDGGEYKIVDAGDGKKTVQFLTAGCRYRVDITLSTEEDFQWDTPYNGKKTDSLTVSFEVQVEKGQPVVTLNDIINVKYGTPNSDGTLSATLEGEDMGDLPWTLDSNPDDKAYETKKDVWYYRLVYTVKSTGLPVTDLRADGKPKNAGTYEVYAVTYENAGYKSATSDKLTFEITQFTIETGVNGPKEFNRVGYGIDEILTSTGSLPNTLDPTNYKEKITDILSLTYKSGSIASTYKFIHVGTHTISLAVSSTYSANYKLQNTSVNFTITTYEDSTFDFSYGGWSYGKPDANPNIIITSYSAPYYPSKTGDLNKDFTITYHYYDSSRPNNVGGEVPEKDFSKYEVNHYVIVLTAKKDASYPDETAETSGTNVDYILPVVVHDFWVTAADIEAPTLATPWVLNGTDDAKEVYRYNENNSGQEYSFTGWEVVGSNIAADGNPIITVTVTYTQFITVDNAISVTFADGKFTVNKPGNYTVTITLNKNYSWKNVSGGFTPGANEYKYIGYVARQQLTVLQGSEGTQSDISGSTDTYNGSLQAKTIGNWNPNALNITEVTGTIIGGSTSVTGEIKKSDNTAGKPYSNEFSVTGAGNYRITVIIANQDDYEWADDAGGNGVSRSLTLEYTLKQATLKVTWADDGESGINGTIDKSGSYPAFIFDGTAKRPTATAAVAFDGDNAEGMLKITGYKLYTDGTFATEADSQTAIAKGFYYIAVSDFGGLSAVNYVLPDPLIASGVKTSDVATMFEISALKLDAPLFAEAEALQGKEISEIYKGLDYDVTKYIYNYSYYTERLGSSGEASIKIEINGSQGTTAKTYEESGYTVTISINSEDFEWKDGANTRGGKDYYEFKFIIEQRTVIITWTNTTVDYNKEKITEPSYEITNIAPDNTHTDDVYLVLTYTQGGKDATLKDAGNYTVHAKNLAGEDADNYKIVDGTIEGTSNNSSPFTVLKLAVTKPVLPSGKLEDFNGIKYSQNIEFKKYYDDAGVTVAIRGEVPEKWFNEGYAPSADNRKITVETINFSASTDKTLELIRAGVYTFTVSLNAKNYYWSDENKSDDFGTTDKYEYTLSNSFTIERKTLEAPYLGKNENRALEWDKITSRDPFASVFTLSVDGISYTVRYGKITDPETTSDTWLDLDEQGKGKQGVYYAELTISVGEGQGHLLNYVWKANDSDKNENGDDYLNGNADKFYYLDGKVAIRLVYAITRGQLDINIAVNGYTFGDNGVDGIATFDKTQQLGSDSNARVYLTGTGVEFATGNNYAWIYEDEIKLTFTDESNGHVLSNDESDGEVKNGLPWNAGRYTLRAVLRFGLNGGTYEDKRVSYEFTVEKRDIEVEWSDLSLEYNGENQMASAKITNVIKKDSSDTTDYTQGLTLTVGLENGGSEHKNVKEYDVKVTGIAVGEGAVNNFKIPAAGLKEKFNITPKAVTVKGLEVAEHIYGDEILEDEKKFTDYDGFIKGDGAWEAVAVTICATGTTTPIGQYAPVSGTYYVRVAWNPEYEFYYNYEVNWDNSAAFVIKARDITVEWNNGAARSEYGKDVNLFTYINPTSASYGGVENAYAGKLVTDIFVLTAYKGTDSIVLGNETDAGTYKITPTLTEEEEGNWIIHYMGEGNWQYEIYKAQMSDPDNTITPVVGLEYSARELAIFAENSLSVKLANKELNENTVEWWYGVVSSATDTKDNVSDWKKMENKNITRYTADTYHFVIKVTAKNHDDFYKTVEVTIAKAILDVQFNYSIMYGEADPASKEILFNAVRTRPVDGIGWTVDLSGFKKYGDFDDEAKFYSKDGFYNLTGDSKYTVQGFAIGDFTINLQNYTIVYVQGETKLFTLKCDNYDFNLKAGTLTVRKINITVDGKSLSVAYNGTVPAINTENVGYTVTHPASTYDKNTLHKPEGGNYASNIIVTSTAFSNPNKGSSTASKGTYELVVTAYASKYYEITVNKGSVEITTTTLDVMPIGGHSGEGSEASIVYNEKYYGLTVNGEPTVDLETGSPLGVVFATASDGTTVIVEFYLANRRYTGDITESDLANFTKIEGVPAYIDVDTYYIAYKIYTDDNNYKPEYGYQEIKITVGKNELESGFNFKNNTATESSSLNDAKVAWIYGYGAAYDNAFNPDGDQKITEPAAKYSHANKGDAEKAVLKYELRYYADTSAAGTLISSGDYESVTKLFEAMFEAKKFNAGYYKLTLYMDKAENFTFTNVEYVFRVAKRALTITVDGKSTVYGEVAPKLTYQYSGLIPTNKDSGVESFEMAIGNNPSVLTKYAVGNHVGRGTGEGENLGKYSIYVDNKVSSATNYEVTYTDSWLTLLKREVTIIIENKESRYNFQNGTGPKELTFKLASGSKYDIYEKDLVTVEDAGETVDGYYKKNQQVITLITAAIVGDTTADVKFDDKGEIIGYTIYAVFNANNEYASTDYLITFPSTGGCSLKETNSDAIGYNGDENNAGSYVITQATVAIINNGLYHYDGNKADGKKIRTDIYSSYVNYFEVLLDGAKDKDGNDMAIPLTYYKAGTEEVVPEVVDAGKYEAIGSSTNMNYTALNMKFPFEIKQATIYLKANDATVEYGTTLYGNVEADLANGVVKEDGTGRFSGFTYTAESGYIDGSDSIYQLPDKIVKYYLAGGDAAVTYSCNKYSPTTNSDSSVDIVPVCTDSYGGNIKIDTSKNNGTLTVLKRKVEVTIVGWDDNENNKNDKSKHNPQATCLYQGTHDSLVTAFNNQFTSNRSLFIFTDEKETFGDAFKGKTIDYSVLGITLSLSDTAVNVGKHEMSWKISETTNSFHMNYDITVTNSGSAKPEFYVQKAKLTLYAYDRQYGTSTYNSVEYGTTINRIVSGSSNTAGYLSYSVTGMLGDDGFINDCLGSAYNVVFTVRAGDNNVNGQEYAPWVSGVGAYTVYVGIAKNSSDGTIEFADDPFANYVIQNYVTATLNIKARIISAKTENQEFEFDGNIYNGGLFGKSHEAVIEFTNAWTKGDDDDVDYSPKYTLSYNTVKLESKGKIYQTATKAPTVVGDYEVTVQLNASGNYSFGDGIFNKKLNFSVTQMVISAADLHWEQISIFIPENNQAETVSNIIKTYQAGYMRVAGFEFAPTGGNEVDLSEGNASTPGTYYFDSFGMLNISMLVTSIGRYNVRIELLSDAKHNIKLTSETEDVDFVNVAFIVTSKSVSMAITFSGFEYGKEPDIPVVYINGSIVTNNLVMRYARITVGDANLAAVKKLCTDSFDNSGLTSDKIGNLSLGNYTMSPNFVAGYYVLFVQYSYSGEGGNIMQERYYVFAVTKKAIDRPEVDTTDLTYNGRGQSIEVSYNATLMTPVFTGGTMVISGEGVKSKVKFTVTDANNYTIQFILVDSANTKWKSDDPLDEEKDIGSTLSYTLKVLQDKNLENDPTNPVVILTDRTADYGIPYSLDYVEIANSGYNGLITLYYMVNTDGRKPSVNAEGWLEYERRTERLKVGSYWIKAEVTDINENFISKATVGMFTVLVKKVTATVSGTILYGEELRDTSFGAEVEGLLSNDEWTYTGDIWKEGGYSYSYYEDYKIQAGGTFYIILDTNADGSVKGISAGDNYFITAEKGLLVVDKRNVTVTIESDSSDYSVAPDVKAVKYSVDYIAPGEGKEVLKIEFSIGTDDAIATNRSAAGTYWITIKSYDDTNYVISYQRAVYTINPLQVEIQLDVQTDAEFGGNIWVVKPKENSLIISNPKADAKFVYGELSKEDGLKLEYSGTSNSGIPVGKSEIPSLAGTYLVKVVGASDNYTLVGMPEFTFTINKKGLDDSLLGIENQTYNGTALTPVVAVKDNEYALALFSVSAPECINANSYDVTVTLTDAYNYQWLSTPGASVVVKFTVDKATDEETTRLTITGWSYGNYSAAVNSPSAQVKSGGTIYYEYSSDGGKTYTSVVPENGNVGTYYVRVVVAESSNFSYFEGTPVSFTITKYLLTVPKLTSEDIVYTGEELIATISDFDSRYMAVTDDSDARTFLGASSITAVAINAGVYNIYVALLDNGNFGWLENAGDAQGVLTLNWTIGRKKVKLPTAGKNNFIVNGEEIVYIPEGFDESIMTIENNVYSYGGNFKAEIRLKDTSNYEWINGEEVIKLDWRITGAETVFTIILTALLLCLAGSAAGIIAQLLLERRRKRTEASTMNDIESKDIEENTAGEEVQE